MDSKKTTSQELEELRIIGEGLKKLRKEKGYSNYHKLAYDMDMTHSQYGAYENGKNMNLLTLIKILHFHKISLTEFVNSYLN